MSMTESEAKTKWCPKSVTSQADEHSFNRYGNAGKADFPYDCRCIASRCMWWAETQFYNKGDSEPHGHCGAVGK